MLSERQELSAAAARLGDRQTTVENLARAGWLRLDSGRVAFAHEAFFDYAYAQQHMRTGVPLLALLRAGEQHLFRRAQVRQILALEREQDRGQYLDDVREILAADDVRPHLKELAVALVTLVADPGLDEWQALSVLGDPMKDPLAERACWLAARAEGFSRLLLDSGTRQRVPVRPGHRGPRDLAVHADGAGPPRRGGVPPAPVRGPGWLVRAARPRPERRCRWTAASQAVTLMIAFIDAGGLDEAVRGLPRRSGDVFTLMHGFSGPSAASGSRLVAAWLRRRLALLIADGAYRQPPGPAAEEGADPPRSRQLRHG